MLQDHGRLWCGQRRASILNTLGLASLLVLWGPVFTSADVELPAVFGDHMMLQAGMSVPIWGRAEGNESLVVEFAGQRVSTRADPLGQWRVNLEPLTASAQSRELAITGNNVVRIADVLVGEVWFCAGQSNMEWPLSKSADAATAVDSARQPAIRLYYLRGAARGGSGQYTAEHLSRLTPAKFCQGVWSPSNPATAANFSAVAYFFGQRLHEKLDVPVGLICSAIGGTPAESWISHKGLASRPETASLVQGNWMENDHLSPWCRERARSNFVRARQAGEAIPCDELGPHHSFKPTFMYQAGVAPVVPFAIRGVIWYQGESNAESPARVAQHELLFPLLVRQWRTDWGQGDMPFIFVQLPALGRPDWPAFRDQQRRFLDRLPNLGMAITMDVGHPTNVHPTNKRTVGERLANWALVKTYRIPNVTALGPIVRSARLVDSQLTLRFDHADGLTTSDGEPPGHFEILAANGDWQALEVDIRGQELQSDVSQVSEPQAVRYGWQPYPDPPLNLVNSSQVPASPFAIPVVVARTNPAEQ